MPQAAHRIIPITPIPSAPGELKIQARATAGLFSRWRWAMVWLTQAVFYGLPWLSLHDRQAVLFDLEARRFFIFGAVLYPQDLIFLTALLVASALLLFLATAVAGRVWCGFSCPQTVYTEVFLWVERCFEGDRQARLRLDAAPWRARKWARRGGKHLAWGLVSLWTGFTLVGWFTPIRALTLAVPAAALGPWEIFWTLFYGAATYANAGFLREKVCQHMCPYGRFQGALMDQHTLLVAYDARRGEPRGTRARGSSPQAAGQGDCVDCTWCVQVCPVGIDIRQGTQAACISCGLCIDACNSVMDKLASPRGLIRFASERELAGLGPHRLGHLLRQPRVLIYGGLLGLVCALLVWGLWTRPLLRLNTMRDRSVMARQTEDGGVENIYRLQLMNASEDTLVVRLRVSELPGLQLRLQAPETLRLPPAAAQTLTVVATLPGKEASALAGQVLPIHLQAVARRDADGATTGAEPLAQADTRSTFILPR